MTEATSMEYASLINYIGINKAIHMPEKLWVQGLYTTWPVQQAALLPEGLTITLIFEIHVLYKLSLSSMKIISFFPPIFLFWYAIFSLQGFEKEILNLFFNI